MDTMTETQMLAMAGALGTAWLIGALLALRWATARTRDAQSIAAQRARQRR